VPLTCTGTLSFTASEELGDLGSDRNQAAEYVWHWYFAAPAMLPWLILALALLLPRANHHAKAWLIVLPVAAIFGLWKISLWAMGQNTLPSSVTLQFEVLVFSLCTGTAVTWLGSHRGATQGGIVRFFRALGILVAVSSVSILCFQSRLSEETSLFLAIVVPLQITFAFSMVCTRRLCKQTYRPVAFSLWLLPSTIILCMPGIFIAQHTMMAVTNQPSFELQGMLLSSLISGPIFGGILSMINLPFLILAAKSSFYRERFQTFMNLAPPNPKEQ
jgi:hypothetical protein